MRMGQYRVDVSGVLYVAAVFSDQHHQLKMTGGNYWHNTLIRVLRNCVCVWGGVFGLQEVMDLLIIHLQVADEHVKWGTSRCLYSSGVVRYMMPVCHFNPSIVCVFPAPVTPEANFEQL